jgi:hypothetical protein
MLTFITLGQDFVATTTAYIGQWATDLILVMAIAIGFPLAFWAVRRVIGLVRLRG